MFLQGIEIHHILVTTGSRQSIPRWVVITLTIVAVVLVALGVTLHVLAPKLKDIARTQARAYLQTHFQSSVEFSDFKVQLYPRTRITVYGLTLRHNGRTDIPPLIEASQVEVDTNFLAMLRPLHTIGRVRLIGLQIHTPPRIPGGPPMLHGTDQNLAEKYPILITEIDADEALLVLLRKPADAAKPPNQYEIHNLVMNDFSFDRPAAFHALLTIPKPQGQIHCDGMFGPWEAAEPSETPVSGNYTFSDADLGTLKGISGILSSTGKFSGPLDYLQVDGSTDTPDFALRTSAHPMALHTDYSAIVDGTNGNTILKSVTATFLHTTLQTSGKVVDVYPKVKGRTIVLDAVSTRARVEDLLLLAVKADQPIMTGSASLHTTILIPESDEDLIERLQLDGRFGLGDVHFTNTGVQGKIDSLSRRGQGKPKDMGISGELSDLKGRFTLAHGSVAFSDLTFTVDGASVALAGTYNLDNSQMDFRGKLRLQAKLSQTMTGWKSVLLRPFNGLFAKNGAGAEIPIKITGDRQNPSFGPDFHDPANTK